MPWTNAGITTVADYIFCCLLVAQKRADQFKNCLYVSKRKQIRSNKDVGSVCF